jgi:hypothetical protein
MNLDERDKQWGNLYSLLSKSLALLGRENAFGEADYWIVDDDYGDTVHKLCVHKLSFLRPQVIAAIQEALKPYPQWRVVVQIEAELDGIPLPPEGIMIYSDHVEQHWDQSRFASLAKALNL